MLWQVETPTFSRGITPWYNNNFTYAELELALSSLTSSSPGPDNIPYDFLIHLNTQQRSQLLKFYNFLWNTGIPHQWKFSHVLPIYKVGKSPTSTLSYRPIALTSSLSKVMERMVVRRLQVYLDKNKQINMYQSGHRIGHSSQDALFRLESSVRLSLVKGNLTVGLFIDIAQAFDSISHPHLLKKINDMGLVGNLPCFIRDFISGRRLSVRYSNVLSSPYSVTHGVPQGSVISPTLFLIMIDDICRNISGIQYSLYADDCAIWVSGHSLLECTTVMQSALDSIVIWSNMWGLSLTAKKTKAMLFTRRRVTPLELFLSGSSIEFVKAHPFLGVLLDRAMTWRPHISALRDRCQGDLRLLRVVSAHGWGADFCTLRRLYTALTLSKLDYASFLLISASASSLRILDRIQYAAARTILGVLRCTPVAWLEAEAHLLPLALRRKQMLNMYAARILAVPLHPSRELITAYHHHSFYDDQKQPLPALSLVHREFQEMNIEYEQIPQIPAHQKLALFKLPVLATMHATHNKDSVPHTAWKQMLGELLSTYNGYDPVYTDGSVREGGGGAGVWHPSFRLLARLPKNASIMTVELYALKMALKFLSQRPGKYLILMDSLSSITALQNVNHNSHYLVFEIAQILNGFETKFIVEWVPGHTGLVGNEKADAAAAMAMSLRHTV